MKISAIPPKHEARKWALSGINQHSVEVTGVAGDHVHEVPLRYVATHIKDQSIEGYLEGKYFWGIFWVSHVYAKNRHALQGLLRRTAQEIQHASVERIIIVTESPILQEHLINLNFGPVYAPQDTLDQRLIFDIPCESFLKAELSCLDYEIGMATSQQRALVSAQVGSGPKLQQAWIARDISDNLMGYIELGISEVHGHIRLLYTDPAHRQQGIARTLIDTAIRYAILQSCKLCTVETLSYQAIAFYKKQGFQSIFTLKGLRPMCISTPGIVPKYLGPISFVFLSRVL